MNKCARCMSTSGPEAMAKPFALQISYHHPVRVGGTRVRSNPLTAVSQTRPIMGDMRREYAPSGAQNPPLIHVVPPARTSTTAATAMAKRVFEIRPARQRPNDPDMISIARGKELKTSPAQARLLRLDTSE